MSHPYSSFVHRVEKPSRYVGGEYNQVVKDWSATPIRLALAFPDVYDVGMSHLGTKILYSLVNKRPNMLAERCFAPWVDMEVELRTRKLPLVTLESARSLSEFDVVGFSLQYEMTFTNVLMMMELSGIPLRATDRPDDAPLIIAGGPLATHPEPIAPFLDALVVGDAEEKLPELLECWHRTGAEGLSRRDRLVELAKLGGIYVPGLYRREPDPATGQLVVNGVAIDLEGRGVPFPVERALVEDLDRYPFPDDSPEPVAEAIFDRMSMEIARGCTEGCRFCQAGMIYRPVRERDPEVIADTLVSAIEKGGYDEASLTCLSTADYSCVAPLIKTVMEKLNKRRVSLSVSSLRAYGLHDETLDALKSGRIGGLTFAPEAGTQRMRDVVNKNVSEDDIQESAHRVFSKGWTKMKLYFMIGLPTETDEDVLGIVETGGRVRGVGVNYHPRKRVDVTCSVSSHVPKPHTPFQWAAMDTIDEIKRKQKLLGRRAREVDVKVKWHNWRVSYLEGIMARGDWKTADAVEVAYKNGARFDGWDEMLAFDTWIQAIDDAGIDPEVPLGTYAVDARLPWDHISVGLEDDFLEREYRKSLKSRLSPPCGKPKGQLVHHTSLPEHEADERSLVCYHCGIACDLTQMRQDRGDFLDKLGAHEVAPERVPVETLLKTGRKRNAPPKRPDQGQHWVYRLTYTKLDSAALTGHLDLVRKLPRIFRRAGVPLRFSQGFNPKPNMSFSPALPLGVQSAEEALDIELLEQPDPQALLERLNAVVPTGIRFTGAREVRKGEPGVSRSAKWADYVVSLPSQVDVAALTRAIEFTMASETLVRERTSRKSKRTITSDWRLTIDAMALVDRAKLTELTDPSAANLSGFAGEHAVWMRLSLNVSGAPRPQDILGLLYETAELARPEDEDAFVVRTQLWGDRKEVRYPILEIAPDVLEQLEAKRAKEEEVAA